MRPACAPGTRECEHEGCHARVMVSSGHRCCQRHRPQKPRKRKSEPTPYHRKFKVNA